MKQKKSVMKRSHLLSETNIDDAQDITFRMARTGVQVEVGFYENGRYKSLYITINDGDLICIAQQIRVVLRNKRSVLHNIITQVEEKV
jgi:hypothetical protein